MNKATGKQCNNPASLGCGTLILIAIIVVIFSGGSGIDQLKSDTAQLQNDIARVEEKLDRLMQAVEALQSNSATPQSASPPAP